MASRGSRIRIWCEDRRHEQFLRELLSRHFGLEKRNLTFSTAPRGEGSASYWVISRYQKVLGLARATRDQTNLGFLLFVDGDNVGVRGRKRAMCGEPDERDQIDRIAILVPKWSVETWVLAVCGRVVNGAPVDETQTYRQHVSDSDFRVMCVDAAGKWQTYLSGQGLLPAVVDANLEFARLPI